MCLLLETIRLCEKRFHNLSFHSDRLNRSRRQLFGSRDYLDLAEYLAVPREIDSGLYRCRVTSDRAIREVGFWPYTPKPIESLKLVIEDDLDYSHKYADREHLQRLLAMRENCDEVLIIKQGMVTDVTIGNVAMFDGEGWFTPRSPLLAGTMRQKLIEEEEIKERDIPVAELGRYQRLSIINAMLDLGRTVVDVDRIR